ncbi:hypothetical protein QE368_001965 [Asaia bogorensis NBRC 16594]|nr:hypothetical protein [Asaia bogorensis NBRC 16594]
MTRPNMQPRDGKDMGQPRCRIGLSGLLAYPLAMPGQQGGGNGGALPFEMVHDFCRDRGAPAPQPVALRCRDDLWHAQNPTGSGEGIEPRLSLPIARTGEIRPVRRTQYSPQAQHHARNIGLALMGKKQQITLERGHADIDPALEHGVPDAQTLKDLARLCGRGDIDHPAMQHDRQ